MNVWRKGLGLLILGLPLLAVPLQESWDSLPLAQWRLSQDAVKPLPGPLPYTLEPKDKSWAHALLASTKPLPVWNEEGVTLRVSATLVTKVEGDPSDLVAFIGFTPDPQAQRLQNSENQVGLSLRRNQKKGTLELAAAVKEARGSNVSRRGDGGGNLVYYRYPGLSAPISGAETRLDLTIHLDEKNISVKSAAGEIEQIFPHGLTRDFWKAGATAVFQTMHAGGGRGALRVEKLSVAYPGLDTRAFIPLNLRPFANMGLADEKEGDEKGGWTDQGKNNLGYLTTGPQRIRDVPFLVIPTENNQGKSAVMLYSKYKEFFPKKVGPIPVGGKVSSLLFLHGAAWAKDGAPAATYQMTYEDGTAASAPVVVGREVEDWWGLKEVSSGAACLFVRVPSDMSAKGEVGLYGFRWVNPNPEKEVKHLELISAEGAPVIGVVAITKVTGTLGPVEKAILDNAFTRSALVDIRKNPPDRDLLSDQVSVRKEKKFGPLAFSVSGYYNASKTGILENPKEWGGLVKSAGGMMRYPYGGEICFDFWPYDVKDWSPVLGAKGGQYGTIPSWFHKYGDRSNFTTIPQMLESARSQGVKMILLFNTHALFDGKDFRYVKGLPEERMKRENPLEAGVFDEGVMAAIVEQNKKLVDFVIQNGYLDTVAYWEMDNERWDMKGDEYARVVAAHTAMLREKVPGAKIIVCLGEMSSYAPNPMANHYVAWSGDVLKGLSNRGLAGKIDHFAPHIYPYLEDTTNNIHQNYLEDWAVRNITRSLDVLGGLLDQNGFSRATFYVSEWGAQSDGVASSWRNDLLTSMAGALASVRSMMAIYAHPRVEGATFHPFIHNSRVSVAEKTPLSLWGSQSVFYFPEKKTYVPTPVLEGLRLFVDFCKDTTLLTERVALPNGVHGVCGRDGLGKKYFVLNGTDQKVPWPQGGALERRSLTTSRVDLGLVRKYRSYGEQAGDMEPVEIKTNEDGLLPPYSISVIRGK